MSTAAGFQERLDAQLRAARDSAEERDVMDWIEAVTADLWRELSPYEWPEGDSDRRQPGL